MKRSFYFFFFLLLMLCVPAIAQTTRIQGIISDAATGEALLGAYVRSGSTGAVANMDGAYSLELKNGTYELTFSFVGYDNVVQSVTLTGGTYPLDIQMNSSQQLKEVMVVADIAQTRKTPVAFSNISNIKLQEELALQDLPMVLNSTPGTYATQQGGGDGDARVTIRGFNQRNVAVMLDGVPVNDMENGWVYWSNWFGLDLVTKTMQVQRGLGASKLATPSVGGTINILTRGMESKRSISASQEIGAGMARTTLGITSGRLKGDWGISTAFSYKKGDGWVTGNFTEGFFYYLRLDKEFGKHLIVLSGFGAPQRHGQRAFSTPIEIIDRQYALDQGIADTSFYSKFPYSYGLKYNQHVGLLNGEEYNTARNYYHKPQISLRHSWQANERVFWSNVAYLSLGDGGGTALMGTSASIDTTNGLLNLQKLYDDNQSTSLFKPDKRSESIIRSSKNNHFWYGLLSTAEYIINDKFTLSGGLDMRYYRGDHYREVYDLLGGDYYRSIGNFMIDADSSRLGVGDRFGYDYSGFVRWGGVFGMLEYDYRRWSAFVNVSAATTGYRIEDYMKPKVVALADTSFYVSYYNPVDYNGTTYTIDSPQADFQQFDWQNFTGFTFKTGFSYKINDKHSVFVNGGHLSKAPRFDNVFNSNRNANTNGSLKEDVNTSVVKMNIVEDAKNEVVNAIEAGYSFNTVLFSANVNTYYTQWENKPLDSPVYVLTDPTDLNSDREQVNVNGVGALHKGIEMDFVWKTTRWLDIEGLMSLGDWQWNSSTSFFDPFEQKTVYIDPTGIKVGDAAQTQFGLMARVEPVKDIYFKIRGTYFANQYANFNPDNMRDSATKAQSWEMPAYTLLDFYSGYNFKIKQIRCGLQFNILNALDAYYLSDAVNNGTSSGFDGTNTYQVLNSAESATVFFGMGRRYNLSFKISL
ncbi:MAG: TonB-dependent receptor [Sphingobacteriales bacterium]|nr:TonB-dependent receptor [Sphingobacteriales bacterium]